MIKTNTKKARENVKNYIINHFDASSYTNEEFETFEAKAKVIYKCFYDEKVKFDLRYRNNQISTFDLFVEWCSGLPSVIDTCYYYNRSAIYDLGELLEETESERNKYTEEEAKIFLTKLIYREIVKFA